MRLIFGVASLLGLLLMEPVLFAQDSRTATANLAQAQGLFGHAYVVLSGDRSPKLAGEIFKRWDSIVGAEHHPDLTGTTTVECNVKKDGELGKPKLKRSSGNKTLDGFAISAAQDIARVPELPPDFKGSRFQLFFFYNLPSTPQRPACGSLPATPQVKRGDQPPRAVYSPNPEYSEQARRLKYQAAVVLSMIVDENGQPQHVCVSQMAGLGLDEQAVAAVRQWKFKPATVNGQPVPTRTSAEVEFRLY